MGLVVSESVRCLLLRYRELIPSDNAAFNAFFEKIHPGRPIDGPDDDPRYGLGWYNVWRDKYSATDGSKAKVALTAILQIYYGDVTEASCSGVEAGLGIVQRPTKYAWMDDIYQDPVVDSPTSSPVASPTSSPTA